MTTSTNLVIPICIWGKDPPTHCISSIYLLPNRKYLITGCHDGHLVVWNFHKDQIVPKIMLFGHSAAVKVLSTASFQEEKDHFISSSDNGEMCLWDLSDGRCIESSRLSYVHTSIQPHEMKPSEKLRLFCCGQYAEILIMDPVSLQILHTLVSQVSSDWISAIYVLRTANPGDSVVVAISTVGSVKLWTINEKELKENSPLSESESKQIRCLNANTLVCCPQSPRILLVVCSKYWQLYDAGDFTLFCTVTNRHGERWAGGHFLANHLVIIWSNDGNAYIYRLPNNVDFSSEKQKKRRHGNSLIAVTLVTHIKASEKKEGFHCSPVLNFFHFPTHEGRYSPDDHFVLFRGDADGTLCAWNMDKFQSYPEDPENLFPDIRVSLGSAWRSLNAPPVGLLDRSCHGQPYVAVTASIYIPSKGKLVCGREDGSLVMTDANRLIRSHLLGSDEDNIEDWPHFQVMRGHSGRINCLLHPFSDSTRYEPNHVVSGGADFSVCLWDVDGGTLIHTFSYQGGEIQQLLVPPMNCSPRVQQCICSVASDHSVALLGLRERKCVLVAGRHLFPVQAVKWRPLDDFLVVHCTDGSVYVWQMETGHLDRVVHGVTADDILLGCDENSFATGIEPSPVINSNSKLTVAQAFRRGNMSAFKKLAHQAFHKDKDKGQEDAQNAPKSQAYPMMVQGVKSNPKGYEFHVLFFDTEALIIQLLTDDFATMSPSSLQLQSLTGEQQQGQQPQMRGGAPKPRRKFDNLITRVKDEVGQKLQALTPSSPRSARKTPMSAGAENTPKQQREQEYSLGKEFAQVVLSCLIAWNLDPELDQVVQDKLGLVPPKSMFNRLHELRWPTGCCYGLLSRTGQMALFLPTWCQAMNLYRDKVVDSTRAHWELSRLVSTQHLLTVVSLANTFMRLNIAGQSPSKTSQQRSWVTEPQSEGGFEAESAQESDMFEAEFQEGQNKQLWSLLATLHCITLPELVDHKYFQSVLLEVLATRWQDPCLEVREASQAIMLAELRRIGPFGRQALVDQWAPYLPNYQRNPDPGAVEEDALDDVEEFYDVVARQSVPYEDRRKNAVTIVLLGVIGAEFGQTVESTRLHTPGEHRHSVEGFGLNSALTRETSQALSYLLSAPSTRKLPAHSLIRRAAIDLLGRGFAVWEPYIDVSRALLDLLELCCDAERLLTGFNLGLPLSPAADTSRTARHALQVIATARPAAFVVTLAKEVARFNTMAQNSQSQNVQLNTSVLVRAKPEILKIIETLIERLQQDVVDILVEVTDIVVHCIEPSALKNRGLQETFPPLAKYNMISYCPTSRRLAVGAKNGALAIYDLRAAKCNVIPAHAFGITAVSFAPDGKQVASYSYQENRLHVWQTSGGSIFGLGQQHTRCIKSMAVAPVGLSPQARPHRMAKVVWTSQRLLAVLFADGTEQKFSL